MVMEAVADLVGSATLVALTVTVVFAVTVGAVNSPELEIVPAEADQITEVFVIPVTVAVNCLVPPLGCDCHSGSRQSNRPECDPKPENCISGN